MDMNLKTLKRLAKLFAMLGTANEHERSNVWDSINKILQQHKKSWAEVLKLLRSAAPDEDEPRPPPVIDDLDGSGIGPLHLVTHILRKYLQVQEHEFLALALWIIHTHVFDRFMNTPRLALISPVRGCGKTVVLSLLDELCANSARSDGITAAALFRMIDQGVLTLLIDEADNLDLATDGIFRAVVNSGHRRHGKFVRVIANSPRAFKTFAPLAVAAIGSLPLPVIHRSIVIPMTRADGSRPLERFDEEVAKDDLGIVFRTLYIWAHKNKSGLDINPPMPTGLRNRTADNWRPLLAIADACGEKWGRQAREAAVIMANGSQDEDPTVTLLEDIRRVFTQRNIDRVSSAALVEALLAMEDACWNEWRGLRDDRQPRRLSQGEFARLLAPFRIRPRTIWPPHRTAESKSHRGYFRSDFEKAWRAYCPADTPTQPRNIRRLRVV